MSRMRGLVFGVVTGGVAYLFLTLWMRGNSTFDMVLSTVLGVAVFSVVGTGKDERNVLADAAWQAAAPDLPPYSERLVLEHSQTRMPGPDRPRPRTEREGRRTGQPEEASEPQEPSRPAGA